MVRFKFGLPVLRDNFEIQQSEWIQVKRIDGYIFKGVILGIALTAIIAELLKIFNIIPEFRFFNYIYLYLLIIFGHELLHLVFFPNPKRAVVGFAYSKLIFYVTTDEVFTRTRLIIACAAPLIFLTVLPLLYILLFEQIKLIGYVALYNLVGSGPDLLFIFKLIKLPKNSLFQFNGQDLFMKHSNFNETLDKGKPSA